MEEKIIKKITEVLIKNKGYLSKNKANIIAKEIVKALSVSNITSIVGGVQQQTTKSGGKVFISNPTE